MAPQLFVITMTAMRPKEEEGTSQIDVGVLTALTIQATKEDAETAAQQITEQNFLATEGWILHRSQVHEISPDSDIDGYRLSWHQKAGDFSTEG